MAKSGLIVGVVTLILGTIGSLVFAVVCVPAVAILAGIGAGYLAGQFDRPLTAGAVVRKGAGAGAIGGIGALLAHLVGGAVVAYVCGPLGPPGLQSLLCLTTSTDSGSPSFWLVGALGGACCFGLFEVALMAAMGALGGFLWYQMTGSKSTPAAPAM